MSDITIAERFGYEEIPAAPSPRESGFARLIEQRDEAREALRAMEAAFQAVTALHVAWTELALARGEQLRVGASIEWHRARERAIAAENALVKLGVPPEAL